MARTDKLDQSRIMLQAGQSGEAAKQRAHESRTRSRHTRVDQEQRQQQIDIGEEQSNLNRWERQWQERRADRRARDEQRAQNQANKPRTTNFGNEGYDPNQPGPGQDPKTALAEAQLAENKRQFDERQKLEAAKAGLQQGGAAAPADGPLGQRVADDRPGMAPGEQGPVDPARLLEEQEQQRRANQQMDRLLEQRGRSGYVPTPESARESALKGEMAERDMRAKELNAAANYQRSVTAYAKAQADVSAAKTSAQRKEAEAAKKKAEHNLMQPVKSDAARLNRFSKGNQTDSDWQTIRSLINDPVTGVPPVGAGAEIHQEAQSGAFGPALTRWMGEKVAFSAIKFILGTGKLPDGDMVDMSSEGMQEFGRKVVEARQFLMPDTVAGQMFKGTDEQLRKVQRGWAEHTEMIHKLGAMLTLKGGQMGGMPHGATTGEAGPSGFEHRGDPNMPATRTGQITPEEAGRRAAEGGGEAAPKTGKAPVSEYQLKNERFARDRSAMGNW